MKRAIPFILGFCLLAFPALAISSDQNGVAITSCDGTGGAVKIFSGESQTGNDRVYCAGADGEDIDNDFSAFWPSDPDDVRDIGSADNTTDSIRIRATANCEVFIDLFSGKPPHASTYMGTWSSAAGSGGPNTENYNIDNNIASSAQIYNIGSGC